MEEELICPHCSNVFEQPILLQCCPTNVCKACLFKIVDEGKDKSGGQCPKCLKTISREEAETLSENLIIVKLIELYNNNIDQQDLQHELMEMTLSSFEQEDSPEISRLPSTQRTNEQNESRFNDNEVKSSKMNLVQNLTQMAYINTNNSQRQDLQAKYCQRCAEKKGQISCVDCGNITLCVNCSEIIHSLGIFVSHRIRKISFPEILDETIDQPLSKCDKHPDSFISSFCTQDWTPICQECLHDHQDHQVLPYKIALRETRKEICDKKKQIKRLLHWMIQSQRKISEIKIINQQEHSRFENETSITFQMLREYLAKKEKEIIDEAGKQKNKFIENLVEQEQSLRDKQEKAISTLQFADQSLDNTQFILNKGLNFLSQKFESTLQNDYLSLKHQDLSLPKYYLDTFQLEKEMQHLFYQQQLQVKDSYNNFLHNNLILSQESVLTSQDEPTSNVRLTSEESQLKILEKKKSSAIKSTYQTNQNGKSCQNQNSYAKHRKGNSHSSFSDLIGVRQHSQALKDKKLRTKIHTKLEKHENLTIEDRCISSTEAESRLTFGIKKETQVLGASQINNIQNRLFHNQSIDTQRIHESDLMKRKISNVALQQFTKQTRDFKEQVEAIMTNKLKHRKQIKSTPGNLENTMKQPQQTQNALILNKTPIQNQGQVLQEIIEGESPSINTSRRINIEKQKTPLQNNNTLDFNNKKSVVTPKNQGVYTKREFNLPQSKSGLKLCKPFQSQGNDTSLSRILTMREDSVEGTDSNFTLRRNSRNNQITKQSSQQKLTQILGNNYLGQSSSTTNLCFKQLQCWKPPEVSKKEIKEMQLNPLIKRRFVLKSSYSSSVQVSWTHPKGSNIEGLKYILEYGVGIKVNNVEQFRQIYKGKAFKCIVTDLIPKTNYRFRIAAIIIQDQKETMGEWSDVESISTTDIQQVDQSSLMNIAVFTPLQKSQSSNMVQAQSLNNTVQLNLNLGQNQQQISDKWIQFERPGLIHSLNPLQFGKHYWSVSLMYTQNLNLNNEEFSGLMKLGVFSKNSTTQKIYGPVINYSTSKGLIKIKFCLDYELKQLKVYTQSNPKGELFNDIPELGLYPASQNMTMRSKNATLRIQFAFDLCPFEINQDTGCIKEL